MVRAYIQDKWSPLSFIDALSGSETSRPKGAPQYIDAFDARRLVAYQVLEAYATNTRRFWLPDSAHAGFSVNVDGRIIVERSSMSSYREYGDAGNLIDTARALVLGESQTVEPVLADDGEGNQVETDISKWLAEWIDKERFTQKIIQGETLTQKFGDGVYVIAPSTKAGRPKLRVYDPGMYFPDTEARVDGWDDEDFPPIVHLVWEWEDASNVTWVRRTTWRMVHLDTVVPTPWGGTREWTCQMRIVDYRKDSVTAKSVYVEQMGSASTVVQDWTDLLVDFIPVIHVPNTPDEWGDSILMRVAQILDDIQNADTDTSQAAQTAAPQFISSGAPAGGFDGRPGTEIGLPAGATAGWTDTSKNLDALMKHSEALLERLAQNSRLSEVLLGRVSATEVPSGYAMSLGFHPARQLMRDLRAVRDEKFPLICKFAIRIAQANGWLKTVGETPRVKVTLGPSLPSDLETAVTTVKELLSVHGISTATAVTILREAGLPIEDAQQEIDAILSERFEDAVKLVEATGDTAAARKMLGLDPAVSPTLGSA